MSKQKEHLAKSNISRRGFLKTSGLAMGTIVLGGAVAGCGGDDDTTNKIYTDSGSSYMPETWDDEAEIVIVGYGGAGATAALTAVEEGAERVLILEATANGGGASAVNGGGFFAGGNGGTRLQNINGFNETTEQLSTYMEHAAQPRGPEEVVRAFCENVEETFDFIESKGVVFQNGYRPNFGLFPLETLGEVGVMAMGSEEELEVDGILPSAVPHFHYYYGGAPAYWATISEVVSNTAGIEVLTNSTVTDLIFDNKIGRVVGVAVSDKFIKASKAVLLCCGSFRNNEDMMAQYAPNLIDTAPLSVPMDKGMGIKMAQSLGADVWAMDAVVFETFILPAYLLPTNTCYMVKGIMVNQAGTRFMAETKESAYLGQFLYNGIYKKVYYIIDQTIKDALQFTDDMWNSLTSYTAETIEDLAVKIEVPAASLQNTVSTYNAYAANGTDPDFNKVPSQIQEVNTAPFYAVALDVTNLCTLTAGGLHVNAKTQVLKGGTPIAGLYAAGATASHLSSVYYQSGSCVSSAQVFGRIAGKEMVKEDVYE
jgi:3-oxo-5alpha-steroid 4-dehydrogenase